MNLFIVFIGGGLGSLSRFLISKWFPLTSFQSFPIATFLSNILACLIMGLAIWFLKDKTNPANWQLFILTGFCGGFSTFSTFSFETIQLIENNQWLLAVANVFISVTTCLLILYLFIKFR